MTTDLTDFERLVLRMRAAQVQYFRSKGQDTNALRDAKDLERQVDLALTGRTMTAQQPSLFDPR